MGPGVFFFLISPPLCPPFVSFSVRFSLTRLLIPCGAVCVAGAQVLYLTEPLDEITIQSVDSFDGKVKQQMMTPPHFEPKKKRRRRI